MYPPIYVIETLKEKGWEEELPVFNSLIGAWTHLETLKESDAINANNPWPRRVINANAIHLHPDLFDDQDDGEEFV